MNYSPGVARSEERWCKGLLPTLAYLLPLAHGPCFNYATRANSFGPSHNRAMIRYCKQSFNSHCIGYRAAGHQATSEAYLPCEKGDGMGLLERRLKALSHEVHPCLLSKVLSSSAFDCSSPAWWLEIHGGAALVRPCCSAPEEKQQQQHGRNKGPPHMRRCRSRPMHGKVQSLSALVREQLWKQRGDILT